MRGYVEQMERLAYFMPEGREPTDAEVCEAMADRHASRIDAARDDELIPGRDDMDEDLVPCLWCDESVPAEMARCTDSGWACETCLENMS